MGIRKDAFWQNLLLNSEHFSFHKLFQNFANHQYFRPDFSSLPPSYKIIIIIIIIKIIIIIITANIIALFIIIIIIIVFL